MIAVELLRRMPETSNAVDTPGGQHLGLVRHVGMDMVGCALGDCPGHGWSPPSKLKGWPPLCATADGFFISEKNSKDSLGI